MQVYTIAQIEFILKPWFLVFLLPIIGAFISVIIGKFNSMFRTIFSVTITGLAFTLSLFLCINATWDEYIIHFVPCGVTSGILTYFDTSIVIDSLGVFMALIASGLGFLIAIFSIDYMKHDEALNRYWFFLQLFVGGMVLLVLAGDLIFLYTGWKIVGVCSYFLIGHYFHKPDPQGSLAIKSGIKAFLTTLVGDIALLGGLGILWLELNTVNIFNIMKAFISLTESQQVLVALLIFTGAVGKSAQFPLITWLSSPGSIDIDAMQGPTTVSALIHAATMVKAGVYLMSRFFFVFAAAKIEAFYIVMAFIIAITAVITAASALVSIDIKRVLAYSTISQLSYMFLSICIAGLSFLDLDYDIGYHAFLSTQFHILSHAIFKALLFLSAGAIIHSLHNERNIKKMGGLFHELKIIAIPMFIGILALSGIPPFNGYFSKESILGAAWELFQAGHTMAPIALTLFLLGVVTAGLTAAYSIRLFLMVFMGEKPNNLEVHKPGIFMTTVVIILAGFTVITGFIAPIITLFFDQIQTYFSISDVAFSHTFSHYELLLIPTIETFVPTLLTLTSVIIGAVSSYLLYKDGSKEIVLITNNAYLRSLQILAAEGFYIDHFLQGCQKIIMQGFWRLRKLQTGDLNYNFSLIGLVILAAMLVFIFF
jgi:NADH-quinone oxidoreductase subunit L